MQYGHLRPTIGQFTSKQSNYGTDLRKLSALIVPRGAELALQFGEVDPMANEKQCCVRVTILAAVSRKRH